MVRKLTFAVMGVFFLALTVIVLQANANKPRILVLHSYADDYVWTREVNVGLARVLDKEEGIDLRFHEMDTKNHSGKAFLRRTAVAAKKAIDTIRPDVLIAVDDLAQELAAKDYVDRPDMAIVFAGINGSAEPYGYDKARNATGIFERKPAAALKEVILMLSNNKAGVPPRALFLADGSHSTERDGDYLASFDWKPVEYLGRKSVDTFDDWKKAVLNIEGEADFLLVGGYRKLRPAEGGKFIAPKEVMSWTEANSPVPVIGMNTFNTEEGAMLSVGVSPFEQGEVAATMAVDILKGKSPTDIPVIISRQYVIALRRSALDARKITIPDIFEAFARATDNYFD